MSPPSHLRHAPSLHCRKRGLFQIHVNVSSELKRFQTPVNWGFHSEGGKRGGRREEEEGGRGEKGEEGGGRRKRVEGERKERREKGGGRGWRGRERRGGRREEEEGGREEKGEGD